MTTEDYIKKIWPEIEKFIRVEDDLNPNNKLKLIISALNSNIVIKENKDIYIRGLAKVAVDSSLNYFIFIKIYFFKTSK